MAFVTYRTENIRIIKIEFGSPDWTMLITINIAPRGKFYFVNYFI